MRKWFRRIWLFCGLGLLAFMAWNTQAHGVDPAVLRSSATVRVLDTGALIQFLPAHAALGSGLIFLPGGTIDPDAYAPLLHAVAESGHATVLIRMPWRSAPTAATRQTLWRRIDGVLDSRNPGQSWVLSGHSRGAAFMRAAREHEEGMLKVDVPLMLETPGDYYGRTLLLLKILRR